MLDFVDGFIAYLQQAARGVRAARAARTLSTARACPGNGTRVCGPGRYPGAGSSRQRAGQSQVYLTGDVTTTGSLRSFSVKCMLRGKVAEDSPRAPRSSRGRIEVESRSFAKLRVCPSVTPVPLLSAHWSELTIMILGATSSLISPAEVE